METLLNYDYCTDCCRRKGSSASAARKKLGVSTLASKRRLHLVLTMFNCMSSKSPPYLSELFLCLHPATTRTLFRLPSSTFHLINLPWTSRVQLCGDPFHLTSERPKTSPAITHSVSNISISDPPILEVYCSHVLPYSLLLAIYS